MATGKRRGCKARVLASTVRALRCARDLYVRGVKGLDKFVAAVSPRAGAGGRPTSRAFGVGHGRSDQELWELLCAVQARRDAATAGAKKAEADVPPPLERIDENVPCVFKETSGAAVVLPTRGQGAAAAGTV